MTEPAGSRSTLTRVIPIGGVGEFGANATIIETAETTVLVDYGLMFPPNQRQPGVDFFVNDPELLLEQFPRLSALFVTHAHEDHIGGIGFLLEKRNLPIYTMPYTAKMLARAFTYFKADPEIVETTRNQPVCHGDLSVEFIGVTHSIAQACALAIRTPDGTIVHTGDFKVDPAPPDDWPFQSDRLRELGEQGVDLLIMDSTNAGKQGFCPSERELVPHLEREIGEAKGRILFTTFSSHMPRIKNLKRIARRLGRRIAFLGRGFHRHFSISQDIGYVDHQPDVFATLEEALALPDHKVILVLTGSQAETQSALMRVAGDGLKGVKIRAGDRIIFSSKAIPGNERAIALLSADLERKGAEVITEKTHHVHTSGHGFREDLTYMLMLTQPKTVVPIHGEFSHLLHHFQWLRSLINPRQQSLLVENGDILELKNGETERGPSLPTAMIPIDGTRNIPLENRVVRERKDLMYSGLVLIVIRQVKRGHQFEVSTNGMAESFPDEVAAYLEKILAKLSLPGTTRAEWADEVYFTIKKTVKKVFGLRPVIRVIVEGHILK